MYGSDVIVVSYGNCPMKMCFKVMNSQGGAQQDTSTYEVEPTFCYEIKVEYIVVLDGISDILMLHKLTFVGLKLEGNPNTLVRAAMVIRQLSNMQQFYTDTSTLRLSKELLDNVNEVGKLPSVNPHSVWS